MEQPLYISQTVVIKNGTYIHNGKELLHSSASDMTGFIKECYKMLGIEYPKFFKMDNLSKLAILAAEKILQGKQQTNTALLFSNAVSSLDFDLKHQQTIVDKEAYYPSPAVFVYTLPNICIGEVSIRHQLKSESAFFISEKYDTGTMFDYTNYLIQQGKADQVLCGWINQLHDAYEIVMYLVDKQGERIHTKEEINKIFN
ncbi:3-oxoacyl-ACP synthase [Paenimyroides ceti]